MKNINVTPVTVARKVNYH